VGLETILILAGSAAGIAVLGVLVYRTIPNRNVQVKTDIEKTPVTAQAPEVKAPANEPEIISEAPSPFPEESRLSHSKGTPAPTDTTALNMASSFVAIKIPKSVQRSTMKNKRKRKTTTRQKVVPQSLSTILPSIDNPNDKEPSAA
jgi:hypothetical protein